MSELEMVNTTEMSTDQIRKRFGASVAKEVASARKDYKAGKSVSAASVLKKFASRGSKALAPVIILTGSLFASDVQWTRFKGIVKALDLDKSRVTMMDDAGDLIGVPVDGNVRIFLGKDQVALDKLKLDDKIQLQYIPINQKLMQQMQQEEKERLQKGE